LDEEEHGPNVLKRALKEEDKTNKVVDKELAEEDDGAAEAVKEVEGVAVMDDSEYRQPIGLLAVTYTLVFTNKYCISTFYFCGTRFLVERVSLWNVFIHVTHLSLWTAFICGTYFFVERTPLVFVERLFCGTSLFVECCYKETTATQEVEFIDKVDKEKVEEESKLALVEVQVVDDTEDVEEEPAKVPPQQAKPQEIAATK
jgi:hypothetical protein